MAADMRAELRRLAEAVGALSVQSGNAGKREVIRDDLLKLAEPADGPNNDCVNCDGTGRQGGDGSPDPCTYCDATGIMPTPGDTKP